MITIDSRKVQTMLNNYSISLPKAARNGVFRFSEKVASAIRLEARKRGHKNTGYLSSKKGTRVKPIKANEWAIVMPYYTKYLEKGTEPRGREGKQLPPLAKTKMWAAKHGMSFDTMRDIIAEHGTKPHPFVEFVIVKELQSLKRTLEKRMNKAIRRK